MDSKLIYSAFSILSYMIIFISGVSSEVSALSAKTGLGPSLSFISNHTYLFHIGHHTDNHIREVRGTGDWLHGWEALGPVHDTNKKNWAFSNDEPETVVSGDRLYLFYRGHNNNYLWFTRKQVRYDRSTTPWRFEESAWDAPQFIDVETISAPALSVHRWSGRDQPFQGSTSTFFYSR